MFSACFALVAMIAVICATAYMEACTIVAVYYIFTGTVELIPGWVLPMLAALGFMINLVLIGWWCCAKIGTYLAIVISREKRSSKQSFLHTWWNAKKDKYCPMVKGDEIG